MAERKPDKRTHQNGIDYNSFTHSFDFKDFKNRFKKITQIQHGKSNQSYTCHASGHSHPDRSWIDNAGYKHYFPNPRIIYGTS